jgi:tRNA1Val (adenine37-N6)-methyltransferase
METISTDTFFGGKLKVFQPKKGYRFSIDAILLAAHADPPRNARILDLGAGCGIISLILAAFRSDITVYGIEIQEELFRLAVENVAQNGMEDRVFIHYRDLKKPVFDIIGDPVDLVVSNPPYRRVHSGRMNPDSRKAIARHEIRAGISDVVHSAQRAVKNGGTFVSIYPADRITDLMVHMRNRGIEPKTLLPVYSRKNEEARLCITSGVKGGGPGLKIHPPLYIYGENGEYTEKVRSMINPEIVRPGTRD